MLMSMTGFGRASTNAPFGKLAVEIQSVNRKYFEMAVSLPKELNRFEMEIRKCVQENISRGQVNVRLYLSPNDDMLDRLLPGEVLIKRLKKSWIRLAKACGCDPKDVNLPFILLHLPPVSLFEIAGSEAEQISAIRKCIEKALHGVFEMKKKEGHAIAADIGRRLDELERAADRIEKAAPDAVARQRQKLRERVQEILAPGAELDERLAREIALFAERVDIAEEITRFHSHIDQFRQTLKAKNAQVGRKLDFLVQEMGREINTIGSKSQDAAISRLIVDGKSELEKVREQIQNVE